MRIGIVGLGFGATVQLPVFRSMPGVEVAAVLASRPERAREVAAGIGAHACSSLAELLDDGLDAVSLALPPAANQQALAAVLERRVAVLSEKPLGATLDDVARLAERASDRVFGVDFEIAELDCFRELRRLINAGIYGPLVSAEIIWHAQSRAWAERQWSWKTDAASGGGVLGLYGSHLFHLVEHVLGPIAALDASLQNAKGTAFAPPGHSAAADSARLRMTLDGGATVAAEIDLAAPEACFRWTLVCGRHRIVIDNPTPWNFTGCRLSVRDGDGRELSVTAEAEQASEGRLPPFRRLAARFVAAVRDGTGMTPDFAAGLRVQALIAAAETQRLVRTARA
jgi:predicted dehydrogenase